MDRVTIYRTLSTLKEAGIVHSVQGIDGVWRYRAHDPDQGGCPGNHPHFICLSCKTMLCLNGQKLPNVSVPEGFSVTGKRLLVYGLCRECRANKKSEE